MKLIKLLSESVGYGKIFKQIYEYGIKKYGKDMTYRQFINLINLTVGKLTPQTYDDMLRSIADSKQISKTEILDYFKEDHQMKFSGEYYELHILIPQQNVDDEVHEEYSNETFIPGFFNIESIDVKVLPLGFIEWNGVKIKIEDTIRLSQEELINKYINAFSGRDYISDGETEPIYEELEHIIHEELDNYFIMKFSSTLRYIVLEP